MRRLAVCAAVLALAACELGEFEDWDEPLGTLLVADHTDPLTSSDTDRLLVVRYCPRSEGPSFFVSDIALELSERGLSRFPEVRLELILDVDGDRRFGPGDEILVTEKTFNTLDEDARGTYKVQLRDTSEFPEPLIGEADWSAR